MLLKINALKNFVNHPGKTPALESPINKTASAQPRSFIKKRLQHRCSPMKPAKPQRIALVIEHLRWQLLAKGKIYMTLV